jgi:hypothetical protein
MLLMFVNIDRCEQSTYAFDGEGININMLSERERDDFIVIELWSYLAKYNIDARVKLPVQTNRGVNHGSIGVYWVK